MPLPQEKVYTINDIYALPNGERAELIDGQLYMMSPPSRIHQEIVGILYKKIANYIDSKSGKCRPYIAPFAVFLNKDDNKNYVEPDICVICDSNKLTDKGCNAAPDLVIEIVSPSSRQMDYYRKLFKYRISGVREYWIIDHEKDRITVYYFETDCGGEYSFSDQVKVNIFEDLEIDFSQIEV